MTKKTRESIPMIPVKVGQVWQDYDSRQRKKKNPRLVTVQKIDHGVAHCTQTGSKRIAKIKITRFRPTATGYKLVQDTMSDVPMGIPQSQPPAGIADVKTEPV